MDGAVSARDHYCRRAAVQHIGIHGDGRIAARQIKRWWSGQRACYRAQCHRHCQRQSSQACVQTTSGKKRACKPPTRLTRATIPASENPSHKIICIMAMHQDVDAYFQVKSAGCIITASSSTTCGAARHLPTRCGSRAYIKDCMISSSACFGGRNLLSGRRASGSSQRSMMSVKLGFCSSMYSKPVRNS